MTCLKFLYCISIPAQGVTLVLASTRVLLPLSFPSSNEEYDFTGDYVYLKMSTNLFHPTILRTDLKSEHEYRPCGELKYMR